MSARRAEVIAMSLLLGNLRDLIGDLWDGDAADRETDDAEPTPDYPAAPRE